MRASAVSVLGLLGGFVLAGVVAAQRQASPATAVVDMEPFAKRQDVVGPEIIPVLAGDKVLVSTTLRLFAFDAVTTELRWSAGPAAGWSERDRAGRAQLFEGIDPEQLLIAPAAGGGIAVAALQLCTESSVPQDWQGIPIEVGLPQRRLFAFELATGKPLWDHASVPAAEPLSSGRVATSDFATSMRVVASPLVVGSRVLVPCTSDGSSIDYHVACYDLANGSLAWSTFVTRGQIERNMFGRQAREFATVSLVVDPSGKRVLAQTSLGVVTALDLVTGQISWETKYDVIPLPKTRSYTPPKRFTEWRNAPPVVINGTVLAAPRDSKALLALDLESGRLLWSVRAEELRQLSPDAAAAATGPSRLLGVDGETLVLGGASIVALDKRGGWSEAGGWVLRWRRALPQNLPTVACLADDSVWITTPSQVSELRLTDGSLAGKHDTGWPRGLLAVDGALFVLADKTLQRIAR